MAPTSFCSWGVLFITFGCGVIARDVLNAAGVCVLRLRRIRELYLIGRQQVELREQPIDDDQPVVEAVIERAELRGNGTPKARDYVI